MISSPAAKGPRAPWNPHIPAALFFSIREKDAPQAHRVSKGGPPLWPSETKSPIITPKAYPNLFQLGVGEAFEDQNGCVACCEPDGDADDACGAAEEWVDILEKPVPDAEPLRVDGGVDERCQ